ncbi:hypothetical protein Pan44_54270 [Caulifigura coniformis]|uniref:Uncharacterized protein n=2 Tax=Caulifigura coniformis TaxID=2527983 RepID=A0A517SML9_9PLAN|nr:hypothetical protein Pan44_54270 [Caulifigura coniformis]
MTSVRGKFPKHFVSFRSDRFELAIPDDEIDSLFPGADCCEWFYERLATATRCAPHQSPVMEDWGWTFAVKANGSTIRVNVWGIEEWFLGVESGFSLIGLLSPPHRKKTEADRLAVCDEIESLICTELKAEFLGWSETFPG